MASMIKMAVAVLDLPAREHCGDSESFAKAMANVEKVVAALKKHRIPNVYGFTIGEGITSQSHRIMDFWEKAGHRIANHSLTHVKFEGDAKPFFEREVKQTENILSRYRSFDPKWFSYAMAYEGDEGPESKKLREVLMKDYRILRPSIESPEGGFNRAFERCRKSDPAFSLSEFTGIYLDSTGKDLDYLNQLGKRIFGRQITHIYAYHLCEFTALILDEILSFYESRGAQWVSLEEASKDPLYNGEWYQTGPRSVLHAAAEKFRPGDGMATMEEMDRINPIVNRLSKMCVS